MEGPSVQHVLVIETKLGRGLGPSECPHDSTNDVASPMVWKDDSFSSEWKFGRSVWLSNKSEILGCLLISLP